MVNFFIATPILHYPTFFQGWLLQQSIVVTNQAHAHSQVIVKPKNPMNKPLRLSRFLKAVFAQHFLRSCIGRICFCRDGTNAWL
jgi:hypothetical protein